MLRELIVKYPALRIMVFSSNSNRNEAVTAIKAGARGYGRNDLSKPLLQKAARVIAKGEMSLGRDLIPMLINEMIALHHPREEARNSSATTLKKNDFRVLDELSPRQFQIASLIGTGQDNRAISGQLNIDQKTVKAHLTAIFRKLNLSSRTQLALAVSQSITSQNYSKHQFWTKAPLSLNGLSIKAPIKSDSLSATRRTP